MRGSARREEVTTHPYITCHAEMSYNHTRHYHLLNSYHILQFSESDYLQCVRPPKCWLGGAVTIMTSTSGIAQLRSQVALHARHLLSEYTTPRKIMMEYVNLARDNLPQILPSMSQIFLCGCDDLSVYRIHGNYDTRSNANAW